MARNLIDTFKIVTESGDEHTVYEYQDFTEFRPLSGPVRQIPGLKELVLDAGGHVNFVSDNEFKVVATGETARRLQAVE